MALVAGVDSSTQSCKVVIRDAETGERVRSGRAAHPDGTEVAPAAWWEALRSAIVDAGGLDGVAAISVGGQQHGMVCLDEDGEVVRDALLWNDTRSADAATDLIEELGGPQAWADATGSVPVASFTVTKLRWLRDHEPTAAGRTAAVCLPHDVLTWWLRGSRNLAELTTDRGDASGTGYFSARDEMYRPDLLELAVGSQPLLPRVLGPVEPAGQTPDGVTVAPGTGDNMAAALGVGLEPGDVVVSLGTSGTAFGVAPTASADPTGAVAGFADATGQFLPLVCTLNAARVLDATCSLLGIGHERLADLALSAPAGAGGLTLVPYLEGERTPNLPDASGAIHGLTLATSTPGHLARAAVEGMLCGLADAVDALAAAGATISRVLLIGGAATSPAVRRIAPTVFGRPVLVPAPGEYVADGAARQAAWILQGGDGPPSWSPGDLDRYDADPVPAIRERYAEARERFIDRSV
jgi:xylulokinase